MLRGPARLCVVRCSVVGDFILFFYLLDYWRFLPARHLAAQRLRGPERLQTHIKQTSRWLRHSETGQTLFSSTVPSPKLRIEQMHHAGVGRNTDVLKLPGPGDRSPRCWGRILIPRDVMDRRERIPSDTRFTFFSSHTHTHKHACARRLLSRAF